MNKICLAGRLTRDPEIRYTENNKTVICNITVAVDRRQKDANGEKQADFIPCVLFGKAAETCGNYFAKGHRIALEGRLQVRNFTGRDGVKKWFYEVVVDNFDFIETKAEANARRGDVENTNHGAHGTGFDVFGTVDEDGGPYKKQSRYCPAESIPF